VKPLSDALTALYNTINEPELGHFSWTETEVFAMMEEVTTFPDPWAMDNFAAVLIHNPVLIPTSLIYRCSQHYMQETGNFVFAILTMVFRWRQSFHLIEVGMMGTMTRLITSELRRDFFRTIVTAHQTRIQELLSLNGANMRNDLSEAVNAYGLARRIFNQMVNML